jgi:hypothetical protein
MKTGKNKKRKMGELKFIDCDDTRFCRNLHISDRGIETIESSLLLQTRYFIQKVEQPGTKTGGVANVFNSTYQFHY